MLQFPSHGLSDIVLLHYLYNILDTINKGIPDQLIRTFYVASILVYKIIKINHALYTRNDRVYPLNLGLTKDKLNKNQEHDENMGKMMIQIAFLTKHVMGVVVRL